tara:strand:- start:1690 stop:1836 length:147 start_codon:yes stop_codon:yes gene_type:complete
MAGNKFDTKYPKHQPKAYHVLFLDQNSDVVKWEGDAKQIINNILQQQL